MFENCLVRGFSPLTLSMVCTVISEDDILNIFFLFLAGNRVDILHINVLWYMYNLLDLLNPTFREQTSISEKYKKKKQ